VGIDKSGWRLLAMLRRLGVVNLKHTAMLGRQQLLAARSELPDGTIPDGFAWTPWKDYADDLFHGFGAESVSSYDNSDYEGATYVHDFNTPLSEEHMGRYTLVYDGGTIEHILNAGQVIANHNALMQDQGHLIVHSQCNGEPGHGFYQLSPEFFYSTLAPNNGFEDTRVFLVDFTTGRWHLVVPPATLGERNTIPNRRFDILCVSRKSRTVGEIHAQQSDYQATWDAATIVRPRRKKRFRFPWQDKGYLRFLDQAPVFSPETATANLFEGKEIYADGPTR
jgi:hypothetical protein